VAERTTRHVSQHHIIWFSLVTEPIKKKLQRPELNEIAFRRTHRHQTPLIPERSMV
jgi:hypothetical protein